MIRLLTLAALLPTLAACDAINILERKPTKRELYQERLNAPPPAFDANYNPTPVEPAVPAAEVIEVVEITPEPVAEPVYQPPVYEQTCVPVFRVSSCDADGNITDWVYPS